MKDEKPPYSKNKHQALGRGMASLFPGSQNTTFRKEVSAAPESPPKPTHRIPGVSLVETESIEANSYQPRRDFKESSLKELAESIRANGIIQPLVVRRVGSSKKLELIAGERRLRAAKKIGLKQVPVVIRDSSDKESLEMALVENVQREDLNCIDIALSCFQLMEDFKLTQEEIAKRVGKNRSSVANYIRLLKLPEQVISGLRNEEISFGHGRALLSLKDSMQMLLLYKEIVRKDLSVREAEKRALRYLEQEGNSTELTTGTKSKSSQTPLMRMAEKIARTYGARVEFKGSEKKGRIVIRYFSREELERIIEQLLKSSH